MVVARVVFGAQECAFVVSCAMCIPFLESEEAARVLPRNIATQCAHTQSIAKQPAEIKNWREFWFGDFVPNSQTAKFKPLPKFHTTKYGDMYIQLHT